MNQLTPHIIPLIKVIVLVSVLFVWVIRYDNIIKEFQDYKLPAWLRDLVGIMKITCVYLINFSTPEMARFGAAVLAFLMGSAMITHLRVKNPIFKMLPSTILFTISLVIYFN